MLPILIYAGSAATRSGILAFLNSYARTSHDRFTILNNTDSADQAARSIRSTPGVFLLIAGVGGGKGADTATGLEHDMAAQNRDSYTVYWLSGLEQLPAVAASCLRPAGFVLPPPDQRQFDQIMARVFADYAALTQAPDENFLTLQNGGTTYRVPVSTVSYIEALDKKLNIWTGQQCLTVYEKLGHVQEILGDAFFRCHRSYLINFACLESVDFAAMEITLKDGVRLPLSRSGKAPLKERMRKEGLSGAG